MEDKDTKSKIYIAIICAITIIVIGFVGCSYKDVLYPRDNQSQITLINNAHKRSLITAEANEQLLHKDSIAYLNARIDSLQNVTEHIDDQYQMDIDIMLDKINGWIGLWLAIITILLAIAAFWQIYRQHTIDKDARDLMDNLTQKASDLKKNLLRDSEIRRKRISLIHLSQTISQIPDASYIPGSMPKDKFCKKYLTQLSEAFLLYVNSIDSNLDIKLLTTENCVNLSAILLHLYMAITKTQFVFSKKEYTKQIATLRDNIKKVLEGTLTGNIKKQDVIENLVVIEGNLQSIVDVLK